MLYVSYSYTCIFSPGIYLCCLFTQLISINTVSAGVDADIADVESIITKCEVQYCVVEKNSKFKKNELAFDIFYLECVNYYTDNWKLDTITCNYVC